MSESHMQPIDPNRGHPEGRVPDDLVKQIRKLRWMGLDGEAKLLESALRHMRAADVVLGAPPETD